MAIVACLFGISQQMSQSTRVFMAAIQSSREERMWRLPGARVDSFAQQEWLVQETMRNEKQRV